MPDEPSNNDDVLLPPPVPPEGQSAPPPYAPYNRPVTGNVYGSSEALQNLYDGYFGLNTVFLVNIILVFAARGAQAANSLVLIIGVLVALLLVVAFMSFPHNKKIMLGTGKDPGLAILASILMGLNSALCCGLIGYIIMQSMASKEMKKYGLVGGSFGGIKKQVVQAKIAELRAAGM